MASKPPGTGATDLAAFALVEELIRTLVIEAAVFIPRDAAKLIDRAASNIREMKLAAGEKAIAALDEMGREYRGP